MNELNIEKATELISKKQKYQEAKKAFAIAFEKNERRFGIPFFRIEANVKLTFFRRIEYENVIDIPLDKELTDILATHYEKKITELEAEIKTL